jgi:hypothetical protein
MVGIGEKKAVAFLKKGGTPTPARKKLLTSGPGDVSAFRAKSRKSLLRSFSSEKRPLS